MASDPSKRQNGKGRPEIWASGGQRPPFDLRALGRASLSLARHGVAPLHAWAARVLRRAAVNVKNGAGRIPAEKLGRAARFVPSHQRVAVWIRNLAATLAHASATADPDVGRGNALVAAIEPHLWDETEAGPLPARAATAAPPALSGGQDVAPVVLPEPAAPEADPLAAIRDEMGGHRPVMPQKAGAAPPQPERPPAPPGPVATVVVQVTGYLIGWASVGAALPYGLGRALWLWLGGEDLKRIGHED